MKEIQDKLFECLETFCLAEGGDGASALVTENWKDAADAFENWLKENNNKHWTRWDTSNCVQFYHDQEAIFFTPRREVYPHLITVFETKLPIW